MSIKIIKALVLLGSCAASSSTLAQSVNFTIKGTIEPVVCTPTLSGSGYSSNTLTLPNVQLPQLDTVGKTAGEATITFSIANCGISTATNHMWVHFTPNGSSVQDGRLVSSNAQVHFEIRNDTATGTMVFFGGSAGTQPNANQGTASPFTGSYPNRAASKSYVVRYYAKNVVTVAGAVQANATYTVKYY